jgi:hypothetical protein
MTEIEKKYDFEVAFSFLQQDENLAYEVNDLIQDRFKTFIYSQHQEELAGTDGEKKFDEVFGEKARIVVIFYREDWGETCWTRIEENAIRNRAFKEGYDFTTFVQLDPGSKMPKWLPKNRIYCNFDRYGSKGVASVIEARVQEAGGQSRPESVEDLAARNKRAIQLEQMRQQYLKSPQAYKDSQTEYDKLCKLLEEKTKSLEDPEIYPPFIYNKNPGKEFVVSYGNYSAQFSWKYAYTNSLKNSELYIAITFDDRDFVTRLIERQYWGKTQEKVIKKIEYNFDINLSTPEIGWSKKSNHTEFFTSEKIMEEWLKLFLEKVKEVRLEQQGNIYEEKRELW